MSHITGRRQTGRGPLERLQRISHVLYEHVLKESSKLLYMLSTELLHIIRQIHQPHFIAEMESQGTEITCPGNGIQTQLCLAPRSYSFQ